MEAGRSKTVPSTPDRDIERGHVALLIIDLMNRFDFQGGDKLLQSARLAIEPILRLRREMDEAAGPTVYVNDNFGEWHSEKSKLVDRARDMAPEFIALAEPRECDYFVIKPQFSGFYSTNLPLLLPKLGVSRLVITGVATDVCVLFTAADAHMRDYAIWVPCDAVAAESRDCGDQALQLMHRHLGAEISPTSELYLTAWLKCLDERGVQ